jgi:hypothetical protein
MGRRRGLDDAVVILERVFRPARDDDTELRRDDIEPLRDILANQDLLLAGVFGKSVRFDNDLDPFEMRRKTLARPPGTPRLIGSLPFSSSAWMAPSPV